MPVAACHDEHPRLHALHDGRRARNVLASPVNLMTPTGVADDLVANMNIPLDHATPLEVDPTPRRRRETTPNIFPRRSSTPAARASSAPDLTVTGPPRRGGTPSAGCRPSRALALRRSAEDPRATPRAPSPAPPPSRTRRALLGAHPSAASPRPTRPSASAAGWASPTSLRRCRAARSPATARALRRQPDACLARPADPQPRLGLRRAVAAPRAGRRPRDPVPPTSPR